MDAQRAVDGGANGARRKELAAELEGPKQRGAALATSRRLDVEGPLSSHLRRCGP
jgi:hypothetical protein